MSDLRILVHGTSSVEMTQPPGADHLPPAPVCRTPVGPRGQILVSRLCHASSFNKSGRISGKMDESNESQLCDNWVRVDDQS